LTFGEAEAGETIGEASTGALAQGGGQVTKKATEIESSIGGHAPRGLLDRTFSPLVFNAWLELPFPVYVNVDYLCECIYRDDVVCTANIRMHSDISKLVTGNFWQERREMTEWSAMVKSGKRIPSPEDFVQEYVHEADIPRRVQELEVTKARYVHLEEIPSAVEIQIPVPRGCHSPRTVPTNGDLSIASCSHTCNGL
jgi:hypothetical protein